MEKDPKILQCQEVKIRYNLSLNNVEWIEIISQCETFSMRKEQIQDIKRNQFSVIFKRRLFMTMTLTNTFYSLFLCTEHSAFTLLHL